MIIMPPTSAEQIYALLALITNSKEAKKNLDALVKATKEYEDMTKTAVQAKIDSEEVLARRAEVVTQAQALDMSLASKQEIIQEKETKLQAEIAKFNSLKKEYESKLASKEKELDKALLSSQKAEKKAMDTLESAKVLETKAEEKIKEYTDKLLALKSLV